MFADQKMFGLEMGHTDYSLFHGCVQSLLELAGQYIEGGHDSVAGGRVTSILSNHSIT
jgi:hypothetical protein